MSNQIQATGAVKIRTLTGALTASSGVVTSVPLGGANGVATLDSLGKVPLSQLPASVVTYLGTWNAATNTPTLANGVGDVGDLYICNVAGTVNFGAGPITFAVGDWVIYSGTTWQKSSGQNGTVTSVAQTVPTGLTITGSPITTSGTLAIGLSSGYTIPLSTQLVPSGGVAGQILTKNSSTNYDTIWSDNYADWTEQLRDSVKAAVAINKGQAVYISGANGTNQLVSLASNTTEATSSKTLGLAMQTLAVNGIGFVITEGLLGGLDTSTATAGDPVWLGTSGNLIFGLAGKPVAPAHLVYIGVVTRVSSTNGEIYIKVQNGFELNELHNVLITSPLNNEGIFYNSSTSLWENKSIATALGYTPANDSLVVHLAGAETITGIKTFSVTPKFDADINLLQDNNATFISGYTSIYSDAGGVTMALDATKRAYFNLVGLTGPHNYTLQNANGTLAFTSDIPSLIGYIQGSGIIGYVPKFTASGTIGDSLIYSNTTGIGIGTITPAAGIILDVVGNARVSGTLFANATTSGVGLWVNGLANQYSAYILGSATTSQSYGLSIQAGTNASDAPLLISTYSASVLLKMQGDGKLLIGTTTAGSGKLMVSSTTADNHIQVNGTAPSIRFTNSPTTINGFISMATTAGDYISGSAVGDMCLGNQNSGKILFGFGAGTAAQLMAITSTGVGIGNTASSGYKLDVTGTANFALNQNATTNFYFRNTNTVDSNSRAYLNLISGATSLVFKTISGDHSYIDATSNLYFQSAGAVKMTMLSSGNVGIGTSSPFNGGNPAILQVRTGTDKNLAIQTGSADTTGVKLNAFNDAASANIPIELNGSIMILKTAETERVRITSGGNLLVGSTTDGGQKLQVSGNMKVGNTTVFGQIDASGSAPYLFLSGPSSSSTIGNSSHVNIWDNINSRGWVIQSNASQNLSMWHYTTGWINVGNFSNTTGIYTPLSDVNKKKDFETSTIGLNAILGLKPTLYRMKIDNEDAPKELGFIAQEVNEFIPQAFVESGDEDNKFIGLNYNAITATLVKAIQEQQAIITDLNDRLSKLENK